MRDVFREHRRSLVCGGLASIPLVVGLATAALGWESVESALGIVAAILAALLVLKAAVVLLSVGIRLLL